MKRGFLSFIRALLAMTVAEVFTIAAILTLLVLILLPVTSGRRQPAYVEFVGRCGGWLLLSFGTIAVVAAIREHRIARARIGKCANCNYDLRATPDRCPECGAIVAKE